MTTIFAIQTPELATAIANLIVEQRHAFPDRLYTIAYRRAAFNHIETYHDANHETITWALAHGFIITAITEQQAREYQYENFIKLVEFADSIGFDSDAIADKMVAEASGSQEDATKNSASLRDAAIGYLETHGYVVTGYY
jgi:hypothetical protein